MAEANSTRKDVSQEFDPEDSFNRLQILLDGIRGACVEIIDSAPAEYGWVGVAARTMAEEGYRIAGDAAEKIVTGRRKVPAETTSTARTEESYGHELFADMLREVHAAHIERENGVPDEGLGDLWKSDDGAVLKRYLAAVEGKSDGEKHGFFAALTEYLGSCADGSVPDPEFYERTA